MLFYRIDARLAEPSEEIDKKEQIERANALQSKIELFFDKMGRACHITITSILYRKQKLILCAAAKNGVLSAETVRNFLGCVDLPCEQFDIQEITMNSYFTENAPPCIWCSRETPARLRQRSPACLLKS